MTEKVLQSLFEQLLIAYAYYQLILDDNGQPIDLVLLETSSTFDLFTGLEGSKLYGKSMLDDPEQSASGEFNWVAFYAEIIQASAQNEKRWKIELKNRTVAISTNFPDASHLIVVLQDITKEDRLTSKQELQNKEIRTAFEDLELIFNSTHDAMFLAEYSNGTFRYLRSNRVHRQLTGLHEIAGKTPEEVLGKERGQEIQRSYQQCIDSGTDISFELTQDFGSGPRDWLTKFTPIRKNGKISYLLGSRTDITEIKRLRKDKEELLQRLQSMFREHDAVMLIIHPQTGQILDANPAACTFYGYTHDELISMKIQEINQLSEEEVLRRRMMAYSAKQKYFLFPHKLRSGENRFVDVYSCPINYGNQTELLSIIFDATDREHYRQALNMEKERLKITLYSIGDGVITTDNSGYVTSLNQAAVEITGWKEAEVLGKSFAEIIRLRSEETGHEVDNPIQIVLKSGKIVGMANHTVLIRKDGRPVPVADSAAPIRDDGGQRFGVVMVFRDVSHDKEQQRQILFLSYHDPLTGLYNRRFLEEHMRLMDTPDQLPLAVIMGDVNGLKITNDVFGHRAGDRLLQRVANVLKSICRKEDIVARWGGDEFLIILPHTTLEMAEKKVEQARREFEKNYEESLQLSVSLGCAAKTSPEQSLELILRQAEEWMYHQKLLEGSSYRNTIINTLLATLYEKSMETEEHAERLKDYCQIIGKKLNLNAEELNELALLAVLHDIGKVGVPQHILQKPSSLTAIEWEEMKRHSEIGYRIAQSTPELSMVAELILSHHERWDGTGYPRRLKGEAIPVLCRILAVADAYDAMTNDRVYRKALPTEKVVSELKENSGTQFDPKILSLFMNEFIYNGEEIANG
ncbi:MAG: PAS domain S-box protein [Oscillospiraceae bacterium]|nr:PAS domain S-box protein [Oscillospiraceae bacterium]